MYEFFGPFAHQTFEVVSLLFEMVVMGFDDQRVTNAKECAKFVRDGERHWSGNTGDAFQA